MTCDLYGASFRTSPQLLQLFRRTLPTLFCCEVLWQIFWGARHFTWLSISVRGRKWCQDLHFWVNLSFNLSLASASTLQLTNPQNTPSVCSLISGKILQNLTFAFSSQNKYTLTLTVPSRMTFITYSETPTIWLQTSLTPLQQNALFSMGTSRERGGRVQHLNRLRIAERLGSGRPLA